VLVSRLFADRVTQFRTRHEYSVMFHQDPIVSLRVVAFDVSVIKVLAAEYFCGVN
jgi:hypothetical protein